MVAVECETLLHFGQVKALNEDDWEAACRCGWSVMGVFCQGGQVCHGGGLSWGSGLSWEWSGMGVRSVMGVV